MSLSSRIVGRSCFTRVCLDVSRKGYGRELGSVPGEQLPRDLADREQLGHEGQRFPEPPRGHALREGVPLDVGLDGLGRLDGVQVGSLDVLDELELVHEVAVEVGRHLQAGHRGPAGEDRRAVASLSGDDAIPVLPVGAVDDDRLEQAVLADRVREVP
jgi:hypothetical protein